MIEYGLKIISYQHRKWIAGYFVGPDILRQDLQMNTKLC